MRRIKTFLLTMFFFSVFILKSTGMPRADAAIDFKTEVVATSGIDFYAIWGVSASDVFAGGIGGVLYHYNGAAWSTISGYKALTKNDIRAFWGASGSDVYAVCSGNGNEKILHYDGSALAAVSITIPDEYPYADYLRDYGFLDIWGVSATEIYLVMGQAIYFFNGSTIERMPSEPPPGYPYPELSMYPAAIWGTSGSNIIAAGMDIYSYDGSKWHLMHDLADGLYFKDVWGSSATDVYAVGGNNSTGIVFHYDGSAWSQVAIGDIAEPFQSVWGSSPSDVYAATNSHLLHYDGSSWAPVPSLTGASNLYCIWGSSDENVYISTNSGCIFHYQEAGGSDNGSLTGTVTNAWGDILPGMVVQLTYNGKKQETTTDENGIYKFPFNGAFGRQARLSLVMQCRDGQTTYFTLADNLSPPTPHVVRETFTIRTEADLKHDAVIQDKQRGTEYLGDVYRDMLEALAFYQEVLKVQPEPCVVLPYSNGKTKYVPSGKGFQLRDSETIYKGYNDEYLRSPLPVFHEYSHHIMYCLYGDKFPEPPGGATPEEINHGGYMNPSTSDSFVEGFAQFMTRVMIASYSGGSSGAGDVNERAWDSFGYAEEDAVDGVLWDLYDNIDPLDNDSIQLTLDEIWAVLKDYRANMHEVYKGFIEAYPEKKTDIDQIFINHGFFADTNEGNKKYDFREPTWGRPELRNDPYIDLADPIKYDTGETIGQATNYQRPERHNQEPWPGHFIKTGDAYPFFKVTFTFPEHPYLDYDLLQEQQSGLIYVPVPPDIYLADVKIEGFGDGITTGNPLSFTNREFISSYETIIEQGFYREHDFEITGTMPVRPRTDPRRKGVCPAQRVLEGSSRELEILRRFRDEVLEKSALGELCIRLYYDHGEKITALLNKMPYLQKASAVLIEKTTPALEMVLE